MNEYTRSTFLDLLKTSVSFQDAVDAIDTLPFAPDDQDQLSSFLTTAARELATRLDNGRVLSRDAEGYSILTGILALLSDTATNGQLRAQIESESKH